MSVVLLPPAQPVPQQVKKYTLNLTDLELKVEDATSAETWGPHGSTMNGGWAVVACGMSCAAAAAASSCCGRRGPAHVPHPEAGDGCQLPGLLPRLVPALQRSRTQLLTRRTTGRSWACWRAACRSG